MHRQFTPASDSEEDEHRHHTDLHTKINGTPCDVDGSYLPPHSPLPPLASLDGQVPLSWEPFKSRTEFDFAHFHFVEAQSSAGAINSALDLWAAQVLKYGEDIPWRNARELYSTIDSIQHGDAPWKVHKIRYQGPLPARTPPKWMTETYELCTRNIRTVLHHQLTTADFKEQINYAPYRQFNGGGKRVWSNLMSGKWAWKQADLIAQDPATHGTMFVPVVAGSDKTTVSVGTGHQEYHSVYSSPGNITGMARRAHGNGVLPIAFLPIPKTTRKHRKTVPFQKFVRQMYHACLAQVFEPLKAGMTTPEVVRCPDGHFRCAIYGLGPYIADYPEQVWLACIVQGWCPKCDAMPNNLDAPGARMCSHHKTDFLITCFDPGTLWDDFGIRSDIVVYLAAVAGHVPSEMVKCIAAFLDFCYLVRRNALITDTLDAIDEVLNRFHTHRDIFIATGVRVTISLPRQHSMVHYRTSIILFGSPNGLCSSITESKDIKAVKEPWRRSSRYKALIQMLRILTRLARLAALRGIFTTQGMMQGSTSSYALQTIRGELPQPPAAAEEVDDDDDGGDTPGPKSLSSIELASTPQRAFPKNIDHLAAHIRQPKLPELVRRFLYDQLNPDADIPATQVPLESCPSFSGRVSVFFSAVARFYAPSDLGGAGGMYRERIRANPNWQNQYPRYDTAFVVTDPDRPGMEGMVIGRTLLFFSFTFRDVYYPCALIHWHSPANGIDEDTGMWVVTPEFERNGRRSLAVVHLDCIARAAHLLPVYGSAFLPDDFHFSYSLDSFRAFFRFSSPSQTPTYGRKRTVTVRLRVQTYRNVSGVFYYGYGRICYAPPTDGPVVIITASFEGQPADNAAQFVDWLQHVEGLPLSGVRHAVFGCGNSDWSATYQAIPKLCDNLLAEHGASRLLALSTGDASTGEFFQVFDNFEAKLWETLAKEYSTSKSEASAMFEVRTVDAAKERAIALRQEDALLGQFELPEGNTARAGDYVAILPQNPSRDVHRVLARFGLSNEEEVVISSAGPTSLPVGKPVKLWEVLTGYVELTQPATTRDLSILIQASTMDTTKSHLETLKASYAEAVVARRLSVLQILEDHPDINISLGSFLQMLPSMRVRQYSISSSPLWNPTHITVTVSVIESPSLSASHAEPFLGVGSNYLASLRPSDRVQMAVRPSAAAFHPPADPRTPVVMFCCGSGLARCKASGRDVGKMLLFFGCRSPDQDYLYSDTDLAEWTRFGVVDVRPAFSRSPSNYEGCKYVQDRISKDSEDVVAAYQQKASFFTCGSGNAAKGIKMALVEIIKQMNNLDTAQAAERFEKVTKGRYATDIFD
ncbi:hypothetical protein B0H11DRAFT_1919941 [Mycena galericulata]|nr:hypothetical protein B0H11DRAFT_1919941 [Mycena galericulata]